MPNNIEKLAVQLLKNGDPKSQKILSNLSQLMKTSEGKDIMNTINSNYGDVINDVKRSAQSGNLDSAKQSLSQVLTTPQGAELAAKIIGMLNK